MHRVNAPSALTRLRQRARSRRVQDPALLHDGQPTTSERSLLGLGAEQTLRPWRILFVCSSGGHLDQLLQLRSWWEFHERSWVSFNTVDVITNLEGERVHFGHFPTTRNVPNLLRNTLLSVRVLLRERPEVVISTGAGMAVPFFWFGKLLGCRTVFIEVYDRIESRTVTGRLCFPVSDLFLLQWPSQQQHYPAGRYAGPLY